MNGWELTTFDSSKDANAARAGTKECQPRGQEKIAAKTIAVKVILSEILLRNPPNKNLRLEWPIAPIAGTGKNITRKNKGRLCAEAALVL
jgi:hypothetical protein